jgi:hypothetical protein
VGDTRIGDRKRARAVVEHPVEVLVALAVGLGMVDGRVVIDVLAAAQQIESIQHQPSARPAESRAHVMPCKRAAERDGVQVDGTVPSLHDLRRRNMVRRLRLALHAIRVHVRAVPRDDLGDRVRPVRSLAQRAIRLDHGGAGSELRIWVVVTVTCRSWRINS